MSDFLGTLYAWISFVPKITKTNVLEIVILAFVIYEIMVWIKNTRAWTLLKGIVVILVFAVMAWILKLYTILWILEKTALIATTAIVIIFQPELRRALEKLGEKQFVPNMVALDKRGKDNVRFSQKTIDGIVEASFAMGAVKTGALIVVEQAIMLTEYESTGIALDCIVSPQVLINIFEHNTPLHDGAIIVRGDRIVSATCYLPLSDNMGISKELGTRHRAAVGMSEVSDALIVTVSEETGYVSVAMGGQLVRNVTPEYLKKRLESISKKSVEIGRLKKIWKGWRSHEKGVD